MRGRSSQALERQEREGGDDVTKRTMYMHTLDGKPAAFADMHGRQFLFFASTGHRSRAAKLVPSRRQIEREQQACIRSDWKDWDEYPALRREMPSSRRYGYVLVEVPK